MVKTTINDAWVKYILNKKEKGVSNKELEHILKKENYSIDIINSLVY